MLDVGAYNLSAQSHWSFDPAQVIALRDGAARSRAYPRLTEQSSPMPGLFGILAKHPDLPDERVRALAGRMAAALQTTPSLAPELDVAGFSAGRVHLGLANPNPQPAATSDGALVVWFDGQIYRDDGAGGVTPTADEVALLVAESGSGLARADGVFALACYDPGTRELTLATDRLGFRPLYWTESAKWFACASEVKALLAIGESLPSVDEVSLRQFFALDYLWVRGPGGRESNSCHPPRGGACPRAGAPSAATGRYGGIRPDPRDEHDVVIELGRLWRGAVRQRVRQAPPHPP